MTNKIKPVSEAAAIHFLTLCRTYDPIVSLFHAHTGEYDCSEKDWEKITQRYFATFCRGVADQLDPENDHPVLKILEANLCHELELMRKCFRAGQKNQEMYDDYHLKTGHTQHFSDEEIDIELKKLGFLSKTSKDEAIQYNYSKEEN